jgi:hypothetical protein
MLKMNELNFTTVGTYLKYKDTLAFMIGPDQTGEKLKVIRLGGHIEKGESMIEALNRELMEEALIIPEIEDVDKTFYKVKWHKKRLEYANFDSFRKKPLIVVGNKRRATALFLANTVEKPKPAMETHAIIFLNRAQIIEICTTRITLKQFLQKGGKIIIRKPLDYNLQIIAGVHLKFLFELILMNKKINKKIFE